jgi:predicted nucleotidyltransferase component of viral defense system
MASKVLTPLQERVLQALFDNGLADRGYYLTGGTALAEFYLQHRYSDDLDLFTRKPGLLHDDFALLESLLTSLGFVITSRNLTAEYARLFVAIADQQEESVKVEFAKDAGAIMAPAEIHDQVVVDSFEDIAVNKICAILNRQPSESKDFCDLFFILRESRFSLDYLIRRAQEKEAAFDTEEGILGFAVNLLSVEEFTLLPRMIKPLSLEELQKFFIPVAEELIQRLRPRGA